VNGIVLQSLLWMVIIAVLISVNCTVLVNILVINLTLSDLSDLCCLFCILYLNENSFLPERSRNTKCGVIVHMLG